MEQGYKEDRMFGKKKPMTTEAEKRMKILGNGHGGDSGIFKRALEGVKRPKGKKKKVMI